jgi:plasmid stabilization system protein ParE
LRVIWTEPALDAIGRAYDYLYDFNPQAAKRVADHIRDVGDGLENFPYRGRLVARSNMREVLTSYPYVIRYRIIGDEVVILRVRHMARKPTKP